jgi:hypothetical protein
VPGGGGRGHIAIGGRQHTRAAAARTVGAERVVGTVLQEAQQLDLRHRTQFTNLVEKDRAAGRRLDQPFAAALGAGEGAAGVAEQRVGEQRIVEARHVHGDERPGTTRQLMERAGDELLAGAAFAGDEHRLRRRRHLLDVPAERNHCGILRDEAAARPREIRFLLIRRVRLPRVRALAARPQRAPQGRGEPAVLDRLDQVVHRAGPHAVHGGVQVVDRRQHDNGNVREAGGNLVEHRPAVTRRHRRLEQHGAHRLRLQRRRHHACVGHRDDARISQGAQRDAHDVERLRLFVHEDDRQ